MIRSLLNQEQLKLKKILILKEEQTLLLRAGQDTWSESKVTSNFTETSQGPTSMTQYLSTLEAGEGVPWATMMMAAVGMTT